MLVEEGSGKLRPISDRQKVPNPQTVGVRPQLEQMWAIPLIEEEKVLEKSYIYTYVLLSFEADSTARQQEELEHLLTWVMAMKFTFYHLAN